MTLPARLARLALPLALVLPAAAAAEGLFPDRPVDCIVRPSDVIELTSREDGVLTEILVDRGDLVHRGEVVARLDSEVQESALELARIRAANESAVNAASARMDFRRDELARISGLHEKRVATTSALHEAEVELRLAELDLESANADKRMAEADRAQAEVRLARRQIRSPVDGVVVRITSAPGQFANEQAPVATIAELDPLHVEAYLPIALYPRLALGQQGEIRIAAPIDASRTATVSAIDRVFDAASGTFGVRLDLPNPDHALPGGIKCGLRFHAPPGDG